MIVSAPVSVGELVDKITILEIKQVEIADAAKRANVAHELDLLTQTLGRALSMTDELAAMKQSLHAINRRLWQIEDDIRDCERGGRFGDEFVRLARAVYRTNDERAAVKRQINELVGSALVEEKSYAAY